MRLIDADRLRKRMYHDAFETDSDWQKWDSGCWIRYKMFEHAIEEAPTIEAELVRRRGLWIFKTNAFITKDGSQFAGYKCSECGNAVWHGGNYCPNCGARMEEHE